MTEVDDPIKVAICEELIAINDQYDPVSREKWGPIIPPTSINWVGDQLTTAVKRALNDIKDEARRSKP